MKLGVFGKKFLCFPHSRLWTMWKTRSIFFRTFYAKTAFFTKNSFFRLSAYCLDFSGFRTEYFLRTSFCFRFSAVCKKLFQRPPCFLCTVCMEAPARPLFLLPFATLPRPIRSASRKIRAASSPNTRESFVCLRFTSAAVTGFDLAPCLAFCAADFDLAFCGEARCDCDF